MAGETWTAEPALTSGVSRSAFTVRELDGVRIWTVMARAGGVAALAERVEAEYGLGLPDGPRRTANEGAALLGIGPGKWLLVQPDGSPPPAGRLGGLAALVDQTGGFGLLELRGEAAREALGRTVAVDLAPGAFPPGSVASTLIEDVGIVLAALDDAAPAYQLFVPRSFIGSVGEMIARWADAGRSAGSG
ncbi:MAG: hypothetical protein IT535_15510 [Bauldia sp.]|nr:hypothetical protein [Bauldia sp.]